MRSHKPESANSLYEVPMVDATHSIDFRTPYPDFCRIFVHWFSHFRSHDSLIKKKEKVKYICASFSKSLFTYLHIANAERVRYIFIRIANLLFTWRIMLRLFGKIA